MIPAPVSRLTALGLVLCAGGPALAAPRVVADIAPIQSILAAVTAGVSEPGVILPPGASPHGHSFRPSEARALEQADLVVWVGPALTPWLERPLASLGSGAAQLELTAAPGVQVLPVREGANFEPDVHDHGHDHGAEAGAEAAEPDPAKAAGAAQGHDHDDHDDHDHGHDDHDHGPGHEGQIDAHIWLDPANAAAIAAAAATELARLDPENAAVYMANAAAFAAETEALRAEIAATLAPVHGRGFIVFHDAYQYFERAFGLPAVGSIALNDGAPPSPGRVAELRARLLDSQVVCVFSEPQFEPKLIATLTEGTPVRSLPLDPEGEGLAAGAALYPALMRGLAASFATCLAG